MAKRKGLLVRVGIDSSKASGSWIAPVDPSTNEFAYVPIVESKSKPFIVLGRDYGEYKSSCEKLSKCLPPWLQNKNAHLDPDFAHLTYGDISGKPIDGSRNYRGKPLLDLNEDDLLVFYASLDPRKSRGFEESELCYAIIGLYVLAGKPKRATELFPDRKPWDKNAHTRTKYNDADIIAIGKRGQSGRLSRCIPIGKLEPRGELGPKRYYLKQGLFEEWGKLSYSEGKCVDKLYIQRSGSLPCFEDAERFYAWFEQQKQKDGLPLELWERNN